jgi:hypothetical protein
MSGKYAQPSQLRVEVDGDVGEPVGVRGAGDAHQVEAEAGVRTTGAAVVRLVQDAHLVADHGLGQLTVVVAGAAADHMDPDVDDVGGPAFLAFGDTALDGGDLLVTRLPRAAALRLRGKERGGEHEYCEREDSTSKAHGGTRSF